MLNIEINKMNLKMKGMNEESRRRLVRQFMQLNPEAKKFNIAEHFMKIGYAKSGIYDIIKRIEKGYEYKKKPGGGRKARPLTTRIANDLVLRFDDEAGPSKLKAAKKHKCSPTTITKWFNELGIKKKLRKKIAMSSDKQKAKQKQIRVYFSLGPVQNSKMKYEKTFVMAGCIFW